MTFSQPSPYTGHESAQISKNEVMLNMEARHGIVAVALIGGLALAAPALAAGKGRLIQKQTRSTNQIENQERHRDGSTSQTELRWEQRTRGGTPTGLVTVPAIRVEHLRMEPDMEHRQTGKRMEDRATAGVHFPSLPFLHSPCASSAERNPCYQVCLQHHSSAMMESDPQLL